MTPSDILYPSSNHSDTSDPTATRHPADDTNAGEEVKQDLREFSSEDRPQDGLSTPLTPHCAVPSTPHSQLEDTPYSQRFLSSRLSDCTVHNIKGIEYRVKLVDSMSDKSIRLPSLRFEKIFLDIQWLKKISPPIAAVQVPAENPFVKLKDADSKTEAEISSTMVSVLPPSTHALSLTYVIKDGNNQRAASLSRFEDGTQ